MQPEFSLFTQTAGTTVVTLMTTEIWQRLNERLTQLWRRFQPAQADGVAAGFEADRREALMAVESDDEETLDELRAQWRGRIRRLLVADPSAREELSRLLDELAPLPESEASGVVQHAKATGSARIYQAGRDQHVTDR